MTVTTPTFRVPFEIVATSARVVEQDSQTDVDQCVDTILRTPIGSRVELPEFGIPDTRFVDGASTADRVAEAIERWEPRALVDVDSVADALVDREDRFVVRSRGVNDV